MTQSVGKAFEAALVKGFRSSDALAFRNTDAVFGNGRMSVKSLPDMWVFRSTGEAFLVEAKAVKNKAIAFNRLADHQLASLTDFDGFATNFHGGIAVLFYDGIRNGLKRAFYITVHAWKVAMEHSERKSLPMSAAENFGTELTWKPGTGWLLPNTIKGE